ncbi:hypothetical protein HZH68_012085 [Vespula germanica]|uniref:Uncharacterized protein n=1 Tax=Vespula germanica TaxID=30212 RepID=A0A834N105_VESGE|nr:hypothetical protein HZH68_012085 [Vespula germanica]
MINFLFSVAVDTDAIMEGDSTGYSADTILEADGTGHGADTIMEGDDTNYNVATQMKNDGFLSVPRTSNRTDTDLIHTLRSEISTEDYLFDY